MQQQGAPASPRGCLLVVVQSTATMAQPLRAHAGTSKVQAACLLADEVLKSLLVAHRANSLNGVNWDVAVVSAAGRSSASLLRGTERDDPFVALETLNQAGLLRVEVPRLEGGEPRSLGHAIQLVHAWARRHEDTLRPIVVHCTDEKGSSADYLRQFCSLDLFRRRCGSPIVLTCVFSDLVAGTPTFPIDGNKLRPPWKQLWQTSLSLQKPTGARAFWINDLPASRIAELVAQASKAPAPQQPPFSEATFSGQAKALWAPKDGNSDEEYEDACDLDEAIGLAAVADGATQGIFVRSWATELTRCYRASRPDLTDPEQIADWLKTCRTRWKQGIDYGKRHGMEQDKIDRLGASATFLALRLGWQGNRPRWRAEAVGDSCLFVLDREWALRASFPLTHSSEFGITPDLVPSVRQLAPNVRFLTAEGMGREGECFALATDAVAQFLLGCYESGQPPPWERYEKMSLEEWRQEVQQLRQQRLMVNDDATLVMLRPRWGKP